MQFLWILFVWYKKKLIMKTKFLMISLIVLAVLLISSCAPRDCQGNKHRVKTEMGGYL